MVAQITGVLIVYSTICSVTYYKKNTSKLRVTVFVRGIHRDSNAEGVSISWRHHAESSLRTQTQEPRRFSTMLTHMIYIQIYLIALDVVVFFLLAIIIILMVYQQMLYSDLM